jgi:hypothetical protein
MLITNIFSLSRAGLPRFTLTNCTYSIQKIIKKPGQLMADRVI